MADVRPEILLVAGVTLATGILYAYVANLVLKRSPEGDARRANEMFGLWWASLAGLMGLSAVYHFITAIGIRDVPLSLALINMMFLGIAVGLFGLLYYLIYLYTGNPRWFRPLAVTYAGITFFFFYLVAWLDPVGFVDGRAAVRFEFANTLTGWRSLATGIIVSGPVLAAAIAYGSLFFRIEGARPRYRVALVSGAFVIWFGWSLLSSALGLSSRYPDSIALLVVDRAFGLVVPLIILAAYKPPATVERWLDARDQREAATSPA